MAKQSALSLQSVVGKFCEVWNADVISCSHGVK